MASSARRAAKPAAILATTALHEGTVDALVVLILRCLRTTALMLICCGATIALVSHGLATDLEPALSTPTGLLQSLATPLAVLAGGLGLRLLVAPFAYSLAYLFVIRGGRDICRVPDRRSGWARVWDRFRLASAYRALRWTTPVKAEAVARLGTRGVILARAEIALRILAGIGAIAFVVIAARS